jgi:plastocyanin
MKTGTPNETFTYTFDKPGTYHFVCTIHPRMVGTIVVE